MGDLIVSRAMRLAILQSNPKIGGVQSNLAWLAAQMRQLKDKVDLFVTPEQALTGYPARDLWAQKNLLRNEAAALAQLAELSRELGVGLLVGHSEARPGYEGKKLYNSASLYDRGDLVGIRRKERLAAYDVFEEERHFEAWRGPAQGLMAFRGLKIEVAICEDSWDSVKAFGLRDVRKYPPREIPREKADLFINLSASPFAVQKRSYREDLFSSLALRRSIPVVYANCGGGQDGLLFEGASFVMGADGNLKTRARSFVEDVLLVDVHGDEVHAPAPMAFKDSWSELYEALVCGLRDFVHKSGAKRALLGLSGGIDSAFCAVLARDALGAENVLGVSLPTRHTSDLSRRLAQDTARRLGISFREISIQPGVDVFHQSLQLSTSTLAAENLQSRARALCLMGIANFEGRLLLATGNKSELALGYTTLYGDLAGAVAPLGDLYKTEVYGLSHALVIRAAEDGVESPIPPESLSREPSAELSTGQKDLDSLPHYAVLDGLLYELIENQGETIHKEQGWNEALGERFSVEKIREKLLSQEFKRKQAPPILKVHQRSLGPGWLSPVVIDPTLGKSQ